MCIRDRTYTIKTPKLAGNAVLPGQYADPDIDYFEGKYWIYPTTDGYAGWSGAVSYTHLLGAPESYTTVNEYTTDIELTGENIQSADTDENACLLYTSRCV